MTPQEQQQLEAKAVQAMMQTEGFKILAVSMEDKAKKLTSDLINASDMEQVIRLQAEIKALQTFIDKLAHYSTIKG